MYILFFKTKIHCFSKLTQHYRVKKIWDHEALDLGPQPQEIMNHWSKIKISQRGALIIEYIRGHFFL